MKRYNTPHRRRVIKTRLTEEEYAEFSAPNRLYVKVPEVVKVSLPMTQRNLDVSHKEYCISDLKETLPMT